jgi:peptide/nickel transport system substrate-binding protein
MAEMSSDTYSDVIDRRKFLALTGATGAAALAGCSGKQAIENGGGNSAQGGKNGYDVAYDDAFGGNPVDYHFNVFNPQKYAWPAGRLLFDKWLSYSFTVEKFLPGAVTSVDFADNLKSATVKFRKDLKWDTGDSVRSKDIKTVLELMRKTKSSLWLYLSGYKITNDDPITVEFTFPEKTNPRILKFTLTDAFVSAKHETHKRFLDAPASKILQWEWTDNVVASGPFSFVKKGKQAFELEANKHFYNSDKINFNKFLLPSYGGNTAIQQALMNPAQSGVDGTHSLFVPKQTYKQFSDKITEVNIPAKWGYGIVFNHKDPDFGKRKVRQAVANIIDRKAMVKNAGPRSKFATPTPCGIAPNDQEFWLGDDMNKFKTYGVGERRKDKAAQLLRDAGYSRNGGVWKDNKDGSTLGGNYYSPAGWTDWTTMTNTVVSQLNDFGFDVSITTRPTSDWTSILSESNFKMSAYYWLPGGSRSTFPYFPLRYQLINDALSHGHNYPADKEYTIPALGSGTMTINPLENVQSIAAKPSRKAAKPAVRRSAWHNNIDIPMLGLLSKYEQSWTTNDEWTVVDKKNKHRQVKWPQFWWTHEGKLNYIPESKR